MMRIHVVAIALIGAAMVGPGLATGPSRAEGQSDPVAGNVALETPRATSTPTVVQQQVAQATCAATIPSCRTISTDKLCHTTQRVIYIRTSNGQWCKTPTSCTC
jgi:hypothetical protein